MNEFAIAIMYVATLAFIAWTGWLYLQYHDISKAVKEEILRLRQEVNGLQMAASLKSRIQQGNPFGPPSQ